MRNPYVWNAVNLDVVYGRDRLINELLSGLPGVNRTSYGLTGGRRMGKTTLLRVVEAELSKSDPLWREAGLLVIPAYIDGLALPRPLASNEIWRRILSAFDESTRGCASAEQPQDFSDFVQIMRTRLESIDAAVRIVVMIDEIEHILSCEWASGFFANWRALLTNLPPLSASFAAVFSGANELSRLKEDIGSPLMDVLEWRNLYSISAEDARRLMQEPIGTVHSDEFVAFVYAETGGHPMLLQYVMQFICQEPTPEFSIGSVERASAQFEEYRRWQLSEWWNKYCTPDARAVYHRLSASKWTPLRELVVEFGTTAANEGCEVLGHVGVATPSADGMSFRRSGAIFGRWVEGHSQFHYESAQDPKVAERLGKLNSELARKYIAAWGILSAPLPNYSGAVSEMRDVVTLVLHEVAPDELVAAEPSYRPEGSQTRPTRRQRAKFAAKAALGSSELVKSVVSEIDLFEAHCEQVASMVTAGYAAASGMTHRTATRELAHMTLRQSDSILLQVLPP